VETGFAAHYHQSDQIAAKSYGRFKVLEPEDVAAAVIYVLGQAPQAQIHDVLMRPTDQPT
jgi:NADP-dependent 3-hydroxy acid dehydrogenase YdfG